METLKRAFACLAVIGLLFTASCGGGGGSDSESSSPWIGLWNAIEVYDPDAGGRWMSLSEYYGAYGFDLAVAMDISNNRISYGFAIDVETALVVACGFVTSYTVDSSNRINEKVISSDCGDLLDDVYVGATDSSTLSFENGNNTMIERDDDGFATKYSRQ